MLISSVKNRIYAATALMVLMIISGCAKSTGFDLPAPNTAPGPNEVFVQYHFYNPQVLVVPVNTTVTWKNLDLVQHSITSTTGLFDSGTMNTGDSFSYKFTTPGTYDYNCVFHPNETGKVVVQ